MPTRHRRFWQRNNETGRVTLVGAGPGGADLITVRGARALSAADVIVYDRSADPDLLSLAPMITERIAVGGDEEAGPAHDAVCSLLVDRAAAGQHVVRLLAGDPFVFGCGGEEIAAVEAMGIEVEVVPGVSSALGAPALVGISVTDRRLSSSFTVLAGDRCDEPGSDWTAFATSQSTLVVLMAAATASEVAEHLVVHGRVTSTPVAFVHAAGSDAEQTAHTDLSQVVAHGCPFPSPTVMIIGEVAAAPVVSRSEQVA